MSLKRRVSEQEAELNNLRRLTSPDISSASEATPDNTPFFFMPPRGPFRKSPVYSSPPAPAPREQDIPVSFAAILALQTILFEHVYVFMHVYSLLCSLCFSSF